MSRFTNTPASMPVTIVNKDSIDQCFTTDLGQIVEEIPGAGVLGAVAEI